jgi:hypothetical protein
MTQVFIKYVKEFSKNLIERYGFRIQKELNEDQFYLIEYVSKYFIVKIEKYFREFYVTLYKIDDKDNEVNLFNLLGYLKQSNLKSDYFRKEKDIEECYRKQLNYIFSILNDNYDLINDFFSNNYVIQIDKFEKYWQKKHPDLYFPVI